MKRLKKSINVDNSKWSRRCWRCLRRHATPCDFSLGRFTMTSLLLCTLFLTYLRMRGLCFWMCKPQGTRVYRLNSHPRFAYPLLIINQTQVWVHLEQPSVNAATLTHAISTEPLSWSLFVLQRYAKRFYYNDIWYNNANFYLEYQSIN